MIRSTDRISDLGSLRDKIDLYFDVRDLYRQLVGDGHSNPMGCPICFLYDDETGKYLGHLHVARGAAGRAVRYYLETLGQMELRLADSE